MPALRHPILLTRYATALKREENPALRPVPLHGLVGPATSGVFSGAVTCVHWRNRGFEGRRKQHRCIAHASINDRNVCDRAAHVGCRLHETGET